MPNLKRTQPPVLGTDECVFHIVYIDKGGRTQKMTVGMSQEQSALLPVASEIKEQFTTTLQAQGCVPVSVQLELLGAADECGAEREGRAKESAKIIPFPGVALTAALLACLGLDPSGTEFIPAMTDAAGHLYGWLAVRLTD